MSRPYIEKLLQLMQDNPTLKVLCKVDRDIVAEDGYAWWLGELNERIEPYIDEWAIINDIIVFKSDEEYTEWFEDLFDIDDFADVPDSEWDEFCERKVNEVVDWKKAIFISITTV